MTLAITSPALFTAALAAALMAIAVALVAPVAIAMRRRRLLLAAHLHELRGSITAARLAVDLMPALGACDPEANEIAASELERSFHRLTAFELRFHKPVLPRPRPFGRIADASSELIDVRREFGRLALIWAEAARRAGRDFEVTWDAPSVKLAGAARHLSEALANLLSNALRHGEGTVGLSAKLRDGLLRIEVSDEGPGLEGPIAELVRQRRRRVRPHGHGLSVAARAADRLGGTVTSAPSATGSTVALVLPVEFALADSLLHELDGPIALGTRGDRTPEPN